MSSATDKWIFVALAVLVLGSFELFLLRGVDWLDRRFKVSDWFSFRFLKLTLGLGGCAAVVVAALYLPKIFF